MVNALFIDLSSIYQLNTFQLGMILQMRKNQLKINREILELFISSFQKKRNQLLIRKKKQHHRKGVLEILLQSCIRVASVS